MADAKYLTVPHIDRKALARIFGKIEIDHATGCWNWTGALNTYGYGQVWWKGKDALTHRLLYAWLVEPLPKGHGAAIPQIDRFVCDNTRCCNPVHLRLVSLHANVVRCKLNVSGRNFGKTHCIRGHELPTERNRPDGRGRMCLICRRLTAAAYNEAHREQQRAYGRMRYKAKRAAHAG